MSPVYLSTSFGRLAAYIHPGNPGCTPLLLLHGVYFDHRLWDGQLPAFTDRTVVTVDMPLHGLSKEAGQNAWDLADCGRLVIEILDGLQFKLVIGVGHSWGSMSLLRAGNLAPGRFAALGLCNMPFLPAGTRTVWQFRLQHLIVGFRSFYGGQVAKAMFGKDALRRQPELAEKVRRSLAVLSDAALRTIDRRVIVEADDARPLLESLRVPTLALKGAEDYVPAPPGLPLTLVPGGHVSPLEEPERVVKFMRKVVQLKP